MSMGMDQIQRCTSRLSIVEMGRENSNSGRNVASVREAFTNSNDGMGAPCCRVIVFQDHKSVHFLLLSISIESCSFFSFSSSRSLQSRRSIKWKISGKKILLRSSVTDKIEKPISSDSIWLLLLFGLLTGKTRYSWKRTSIWTSFLF